MWLHIRGVGEWTNRLYTYFEKEQERLHNGDVAASVPGSSRTPVGQFPETNRTTLTPQRDFLTKNLARHTHTAMVKSSSFENPRATDDFNKMLKGAEDRTVGGGGPTVLHSEDEVDRKQDNPFTFEAAINREQQPMRPPRHSPGTSKLALDNSFAVASSGPPRLDRQISENTAIKKIQASLQRTFSRKGPLPVAQDGYNNDAFISDEIGDAELKGTPKRKMTPEKKLNMLLFKNKAPLEKSLSMPDMENRLKKRERLKAYDNFKNYNVNL